MIAPPPDDDHIATCIIADDHEIVRLGMRTRLEHVPWLSIVGEASTGDEAVQRIERERPDLALVDMRMPGRDGYAIVEALRAANSGTHVVIYTGHGSVSQAERALDVGAFGYILKEASVDVVEDALRAAHAGRRYLDPGLAAEMLDGDRRGLSPREHEILQLMSEGMQNAEAAYRLEISAETVKAHVSNILTKMGATSRTQAVARALRDGLID